MNSDLEKRKHASDASLVEWTREGDLDAFEELVQRYHAPLISFLRFYCVRRTDLEDIAQEAFLKCFKHLEQFDTDRKFRNWLYTIARRTIPRSIPEKKRPGVVPLDGLVGKAADPGAIAEQSEQSNSIWETVRRETSDEEFQLMWHRYAEQLTTREVAHLLQRSEPALKMQLSRLRKRLRPHLQLFTETDSGNDLFDPKKKAA